jgi:hypothetical protein
MTEPTASSLRALDGAPAGRAGRKRMARLDVRCRRFIAHSPFLVIGWAGADDGRGGEGGPGHPSAAPGP